MPTFSYTARTANGQLKSDTIEAASRDEAIANLRKQRLTVVKIDESGGKKKRGGKIGMRDIVIFTRQFSTMINSGLPLVQALDILSQQSENRRCATSRARWCSTWSRATPWPTRCASIPRRSPSCT